MLLSGHHDDCIDQHEDEEEDFGNNYGDDDDDPDDDDDILRNNCISLPKSETPLTMVMMSPFVTPPCFSTQPPGEIFVT